MLIVQALAPQLVRIFDADPAVVEAGVTFLRITCFSYILGGVAVALNGLSTGVGDAWFTLVTVLSTHLLLRIVACYVIHFVLHLPLFWVYISYTVTPSLSIARYACLKPSCTRYSCIAPERPSIVLVDRRAILNPLRVLVSPILSYSTLPAWWTLVSSTTLCRFFWQKSLTSGESGSRMENQWNTSTRSSTSPPVEK